MELLGAGLTRIQVSRLRRHAHDLGNSCVGWEVLEAFLRTARLDCKPLLLGFGLWELADLDGDEASDDELLAAGLLPVQLRRLRRALSDRPPRYSIL